MPQGIVINCATGETEMVDVGVSPPPVPVEITMRQARLALLGVGLLDDVETAIAAMASPAREAAQIEWEYAATVRRSSPLIGQLAPSLGLTDSQVDALFIAGAGL